MILSVSTRSDIPAYYGDWFMHWLNQGFFYIKNPYDKEKITKLYITKEKVDCIVFWTKCGIDFTKHLGELIEKDYNFYFQYTITGYDNDLEKLKYDKTKIIENFIEISKIIGQDKVILRYDPILISDKYSVEYHIKTFKRLIEMLHSYTNKVVISFVDIYPKIVNKINSKHLRKPTNEEIDLIASEFVKITNQYQLALSTCSEAVDLEKYGIEKNSCIDYQLIEKITNKKLTKYLKADKRDECLCLKHIDIGEYDTCLADCSYCYAKTNKVVLDEYHSSNELISGPLKNQKISIKESDKVKFVDTKQLSFDFDLNNNTK